jgi:hypothetical protein
MNKFSTSVIVILILPLLAFSQVRGGDIYGDILINLLFTPGEGPTLAHPDASLTLTGHRFNKSVKVTLIKDESTGSFKGAYRFIDMPQGLYNLMFEAEGYRPGINREVTVTPERTAVVNISAQKGLINVEITTAGKIKEENLIEVIKGPMNDEPGMPPPSEDNFDRLQQMLYLKEIPILRPQENQMMIHLGNIKRALLEAGVKGPVMVELQGERGFEGRKPFSFKSQLYQSPAQIPESVPYPTDQTLKKPGGEEGAIPLPLPGPLKIVFKNTKGEIKASVRGGAFIDTKDGDRDRPIKK